MTVTEKSSGPKPCGAWVYVLTCVVAALALSTARAQDYQAVERRLGEAVSKGELTLKQAIIMLDALKQAGGEQATEKSKTKKEETVDLAAAKENLQALVKAGKLTKAQAAAKMEAIEKNASPRKQDADTAEACLMQVKQELGLAVQSGKISKEQAVKRYEAARQKVKAHPKTVAKPHPGDKHLARVKEELDAAVKAGKLTKAQAAAKMEAIKMSAAGQKHDADKTETSLMQVKKELHAAVQAGKISKEEAAKRYEAAIQKVKAQQPKDKKSPPTDEDLAKVKKDLAAAVEAGKITEEEAKAKWKAINKMRAPVQE